MIEASPIILSALGCLSNCSGCHPDDIAPLYSLHRDISELLNREQVEPGVSIRLAFLARRPRFLKIYQTGRCNKPKVVDWDNDPVGWSSGLGQSTRNAGSC
jgi:hypothetical protein